MSRMPCKPMTMATKWIFFFPLIKSFPLRQPLGSGEFNVTLVNDGPFLDKTQMRKSQVIAVTVSWQCPFNTQSVNNHLLPMKLLISSWGAFLQLSFVASVKTQCEHRSVLLAICVVAERKKKINDGVKHKLCHFSIFDWVSIITYCAIGPEKSYPKTIHCISW